MPGFTEKMLVQTREIFSRFPELLLVLIFLPILVLCAAQFGGVHFPVGGQEQFAFNHYIAPTFLGVCLALLVVGVRSFSSALVIGLLSIFSVIAHFNFKAWIPLVNPTLFDDIYWQIDGELGIRHVVVQLRAIISHYIVFDITSLYHLLFVLCFFLLLLLFAHCVVAQMK